MGGKIVFCDYHESIGDAENLAEAGVLTGSANRFYLALILQPRQLAGPDCRAPLRSARTCESKPVRLAPARLR